MMMFTSDETNYILERCKLPLAEASKIFVGRMESLIRSSPTPAAGGFVADVYIMGGAIANLLQLENPNDIDFFVWNNSAAWKLYSDFLETSFFTKVRNEGVSDYSHNPLIQDVYEFSPGPLKNWPSSAPLAKMQIIFMKYVPDGYSYRKRLLSSFDFVHTLGCYSLAQNKLYLSRQTYDAIMDKKLIYNIPPEKVDPDRLKKFLARGYTF